MKRTRFVPVLLCATLCACASVPPSATRQPAPTPPAPASATAAQSAPIPPAPSPAAPSAPRPSAPAPAAPASATATDAPAVVVVRPTPAPVAAKPAAKPAAVAPPAPAPPPKPVAKKPVAPVEPVAASAPAVASAAVTMSGRLQVSAADGSATSLEDLAEAVIYYIPDAGAPHPKPGTFQIFTRDKMFDPGSLVVPLGSTVSFPNKDDLLHNVFSVSPAAEFDLGLLGEGKSGDVVLRKPGIVTVNCNVHPLMQVSILVLDTPYFTHPTKAGDFAFAALPAGSGKLFLWHPRAATQSLAIPSSATTGLSLQMALTKPRVAPHLNKERKPYQTTAH